MSAPYVEFFAAYGVATSYRLTNSSESSSAEMPASPSILFFAPDLVSCAFSSSSGANKKGAEIGRKLKINLRPHRASGSRRAGGAQFGAPRKGTGRLGAGATSHVEADERNDRQPRRAPARRSACVRGSEGTRRFRARAGSPDECGCPRSVDPHVIVVARRPSATGKKMRCRSSAFSVTAFEARGQAYDIKRLAQATKHWSASRSSPDLPARRLPRAAPDRTADGTSRRSSRYPSADPSPAHAPDSLRESDATPAPAAPPPSACAAGSRSCRLHRRRGTTASRSDGTSDARPSPCPSARPSCVRRAASTLR